jgi:glycosyltransferase involved in cell wall biosynthesis
MLNEATGNYIWFLDSDDIMEPGAIQQLKTIVEQHQPDLVMCDFRVLREKQTSKHRLRGENHRHSFVGEANQLSSDPVKLFYGLYKKGELHIWSKITKRALWGDDLRFPVDKYMEDMVLTPRLVLRAKTYFYQDSVWVAYRQRQGSILSTPSLKKIDDAAMGNDGVLAAWLARYPQLTAHSRLAFSHYCARTHYVVMRDLRRWNPEQFNQQKKHFRQQLVKNIHWNPWQLSWQYAKRGLITRLIRFLSKY